MRLAAVVFANSNGRSDYPRLARALERSVAANSPRTPITIHRPRAQHARLEALHGDPRDGRRKGLIDNTQKMVAWNAVIQSARPGEVVGLLDCDTLVLGDLRAVLDLDFRVTYTVRPPHARFPFNSGVVFARIGKAVKRFFAEWEAKNLSLLADRDAHRPFRYKYGGINQAALGAMIEARPDLVTPIPCEVWNCEDSSWPAFGSATKVLHIKGRLREACLGRREPMEEIRAMVETWRLYGR